MATDLGASFAQDDPQLASDVRRLVKSTPHAGPVLGRVIQYYTTKLDDQDGRAAKRVRLDAQAESQNHGRPASVADAGQDGAQTSATATRASSANDAGTHLATLRDVSFLAPMRKKMHLVVSTSRLAASLGAHTGTRAELHIDRQDVRYVAIVPVPEKAARLVNVCVFLKANAGPGCGNACDAAENRTLVFTLPDGNISNATVTASGRRGLPKAAVVSIDSATSDVDNAHTLDAVPLVQHLLSLLLPAGVPVHAPQAVHFTSTALQPHRKTEPALFTGAHVGAKDGFLFFLPDAILWGFKKPLVLLRHSDLASVGFTNVLSRTFDLVCQLRPGSATASASAAGTGTGSTNSSSGGSSGSSGAAAGSSGGQGPRVQFGMIATDEYERVKRYVDAVVRVGDDSLAEGRKAKDVYKKPNRYATDPDADAAGAAANGGHIDDAADNAAQGDDDDDDEDDENFEDDESHGGSTVDSDESELEDHDGGGDNDGGDSKDED